MYFMQDLSRVKKRVVNETKKGKGSKVHVIDMRGPFFNAQMFKEMQSMRAYLITLDTL